MYMLSVGLEHLQSGVEFECCGGDLAFHKETPTLFTVVSSMPFTSVWRLRGENPIRV